MPQCIALKKTDPTVRCTHDCDRKFCAKHTYPYERGGRVDKPKKAKKTIVKRRKLTKKAKKTKLTKAEVIIKEAKKKAELILKKAKMAAKKFKSFKPVKGGGGARLSAAAYFERKGRKLKKCKPQWILQPNGTLVLKKIKICNDAWGGKCPRWVPC